MIRFERTLFTEALELAADNAPQTAELTSRPVVWVELKTRLAVLNGWRPGWKASETQAARVTLSYESVGYLATALEVMEEITGEAFAEVASATEVTEARTALTKRCNMLENLAQNLRGACR